MGLVANIKGPPGSTWYTGTGVPAPTTGIDGDFYLESNTSEFYSKLAGVWTFQGVLAVSTAEYLDCKGVLSNNYLDAADTVTISVMKQLIYVDEFNLNGDLNIQGILAVL